MWFELFNDILQIHLPILCTWFMKFKVQAVWSYLFWQHLWWSHSVIGKTKSSILQKVWCRMIVHSKVFLRFFIFSFRFHYERMDELRMFLENEAFALCPLPLQFTLFDLQVRCVWCRIISISKVMFCGVFLRLVDICVRWWVGILDGNVHMPVALTVLT